MSERLFVVDGDAKSLRLVDVGLRKAGFEVQAVASGTVALALVAEAVPALVIADAESVSGGVAEFCAKLSERLGAATPPVIVMAREKTREGRLRALQAGAADYLPKPPYLQELVMRVRATLQQSARERLGGAGEESEAKFAGELANLGVVDLLQQMEESKQSGIATLTGPSGASGTLFFRQGRLVDADVGRLSGAEALYRLFSWPSGHYELTLKSIRRKDIINQPTGQLLLEGLKQLDEWNRLVQQLPGLTAVFEVDYKLLAERLADIPDEINDILRLFDGVRTVAQVIDDCALPDLEVLTSISRLYAERIIYESGNSAVPRRTTSSTGLDAWLTDATAPFGIARPRSRESATGPTAVPVPIRESDAPTSQPNGSIDAGPFAERLESEGVHQVDPSATSGNPPAKRSRGRAASPRRTTDPGLGDAAALAAPEVVEGAPAAASAGRAGREPAEGAGEKSTDHEEAIPTPRSERDNLIRFPAPGGGQGDATKDDDSAQNRARPHERTLRGGELAIAGHVEMAAAERSRAADPSVGRDEAPTTVFVDGATLTAVGEATTETAIGLSPSEGPGTGDRTSNAPSPMVTQRGVGGPPPVPSPMPAPESAASPTPASNPPSRPTEVPVARAGEIGAAPTAAAPASRKTEQSGALAIASDGTEELALGNGRNRLLLVGGAVVVLVAIGAVRWAVSRNDTETHSGSSGDIPHTGETATGKGTAEAPHAGAAPGSTARTGTMAHSATVQGATEGRGYAVTPIAPVPVAEVDGHTPSAAGEKTAKSSPGGAEARAAVAAPVPAPASAGSGPGSGDASRILSECRAAFARGKMRDARAACSAASEADPRSAEATIMQAHAELNLGRSGRALELARKAAALDSSHADAYVIIGGVLQERGNLREAKSAYQRYLELAPNGRYADDLKAIVQSL